MKMITLTGGQLRGLFNALSLDPSTWSDKARAVLLPLRTALLPQMPALRAAGSADPVRVSYPAELYVAVGDLPDFAPQSVATLTALGVAVVYSAADLDPQQWGLANPNYQARLAWYADNDGRLLNALTDQAAGVPATLTAYLATLATMKALYPKPSP